MNNLSTYIIEKLKINKDTKNNHDNLDDLIDFVEDELNNHFLKTGESIDDIKIKDYKFSDESYIDISFNLKVNNKDRVQRILNPLYIKIQDKNFNLNIQAIENYHGEAIKITILKND